MKIDNQITFIANKQAAAEPGCNILFADWLDAPTTNSKGDDYYWQHQDQLQQSDLTFTTINKLKRATMPENEGQLSNHESQMAAKDNAPSPLPPLASVLKPDTALLKPLLNPVSPMKPAIAVFKKMLDATTSPMDSKIISKLDTNTRVIEAIIKQNMPTSLIFKNHQLFIKDNAAELTLNTSKLSREETHELQKLLKQWFTNKGYALTKLIINGVLQ